ncbi:NAD(P)-dependent oxidoreductase [Oceaniserpentilla sp. 4NH20-0058]|uniref:NAD(P)-dependent oxidoreductase n=1 Tax=Oceaniserpentilla sp. 4NH20-0058 TaxID=3127660 RepID=UPI003101D7DC
MAKIGFIGIGLMGLPMCKRLLTAGESLWVYNRNEAKCQLLVELGAQQADSIESLSQVVDIIMLCVSDTQAVQAVAQAIFSALKPDQVIVDFSSISPDATQELAQQANAKGAHWVDCPVSGGVAGAQAGTLAMMAGGNGQVIQQLEPVLMNLGQRLTHMGESGSGQTTKICNQMIVSCNVLVLAEVMAMAKRAGVDATKIPQALKGGFADSTPLQLTGTRMAVQDFDEIKWHVKTLLKDLDMANLLAKELGSAIPMAGLGAELMRQHASKGYAEQDPATFVAMYESINNTPK